METDHSTGKKPISPIKICRFTCDVCSKERTSPEEINIFCTPSFPSYVTVLFTKYSVYYSHSPIYDRVGVLISSLVLQQYV